MQMARRSTRAAWTAGLVLGSLLCPLPVAAQAPGGFLRLNGVYPARTPQAFETTLDLPLYGETAEYGIRHEPKQKIYYDATLGARFWRGLGAAVSVSFLDTKSATTASGSIPSPLVFHNPRAASFSTEQDRRQLDIHVQAVYFLPMPSAIDIAFSAGPSLLRVTRHSVSDVTLGAETFPFGEVSIASLGATRVHDIGIGANVGLDIALMPTRVFGVGLFARYVIGSVDTGSRKLDAGGLQAGAGLRFRF